MAEGFGVPNGHTLIKTSFKDSRGGQSERWEYDEFDDRGQLVGRVSHVVHSDYYGKVEREEWCRQNLAGEVLATGNT